MLGFIVVPISAEYKTCNGRAHYNLNACKVCEKLDHAPNHQFIMLARCELFSLKNGCFLARLLHLEVTLSSHTCKYTDNQHV